MEKARRLPAIAKWINENMPEYRAKITEGYCNTDRKISGSRLRVPGKRVFKVVKESLILNIGVCIKAPKSR